VKGVALVAAVAAAARDEGVARADGIEMYALVSVCR
jgi:hypothetical protein